MTQIKKIVEKITVAKETELAQAISFNIQRFAAIYGTARADSIDDVHDNIVISGGASADTINAYGASVTIDGGSDADKITATGDGACISGGSGNDTITSNGDGANIAGGSGSDVIVMSGNDGIADGGAGNDKISLGSSASDNTLSGGADNYTIDVAGKNNIIILDGGKDVIRSYTEANKISIGSGVNYIIEMLTSGDSRISLESGATVTLKGYTGEVNIIGGKTVGTDMLHPFVPAGDVSIEPPPTIIDPPPIGPYDPPVTISSALRISNNANNILIVGTSEADTVFNTGSGVTISTGAENDIVGNYSGVGKNTLGQSVLIETGDGNDTVSNSYSQVFIDVADGKNSITSSGGDVTIKAGNDADSINAHGSSDISINAGNGRNFVMSNGANNTVLSGSDADLIYVGGDNPVIQTGAQNDSIYVGNHIFSIKYPLSSVNYHFARCENGTIDAGTGNDIINFTNSTNNIIIFKPDSGRDTIIGGAGNSLSVAGSTKYTVEESGGGTEETRLPIDVIQDFMFALDNSAVTSAVVYKADGTTVSAGAQILDDAIAAATKWDRFEEAKAEFIDLLHVYLKADPVNGGEKLLLAECGINLRNDDTGSIIGYDAGTSPVELNASDVVKETGMFDENFSYNSFTVNGGLKVELDKDFSQLSDVEQYVWKFLNFCLPAVLSTISKGYGENFNFGSKSSSTLTENKIRLFFYNDNDGNIASVNAGTINSRGETNGPLTLKINMKYYKDIILGDEDGKSSATSQSLDRVLAHELVHATMNANINFATGGDGLPQFVKDGLAELIHGADDTRRLGKAGITALVNDPGSFADVLDADKLYGNPAAYAAGYTFWRWIGHQNSSSLFNSQNVIDFYSDANIEQPAGTVKGAVLTVKENPENPIIDLAHYATSVTKVNATALTESADIIGTTRNESIKAGKGADQIYGGAGDDTLFGGSGNDKLYGDADDDILIGGLGNDTLTGGTGSDLFVYESGSDVIADYTVGIDKIQVGESISSASLKGTDVMLNFYSGGSLKVKNVKNKKITVIDAATGEETSQIYGLLNYSAARTVVTLVSSFIGTLQAADYDYTVKKIDASAVSKSVNLVGNANSNTIIGSAKADTIYGGNGADSIRGEAGNDKIYGDAGADTLWGGAGNDTLTGGAGADLFVYKAGKDVITDYSAGDKIKLDAAIKKTSFNGQSVIFTIGSGTLTVKNGKGKDITITDASGKNLIYSSNGLRGSNALWFIEDDTNFIGETNLDAISTENYSVTNVETVSAENLVQNENDSLLCSALTFAFK